MRATIEGDQDHRSLPPDQNAADVLGWLAGAP